MAEEQAKKEDPNKLAAQKAGAQKMLELLHASGTGKSKRDVVAAFISDLDKRIQAAGGASSVDESKTESKKQMAQGVGNLIAHLHNSPTVPDGTVAKADQLAAENGLQVQEKSQSSKPQSKQSQGQDQGQGQGQSESQGQ